MIFLAVALCTLTSRGITAVAVIMLSYHALFLSCSFVLVGRRMHIGIGRFAGWVLPAILCTALMVITVRTAATGLLVEKTLFNLLSLVAIGGGTYIVGFFLLRFRSTDFLRREAVGFCKKFYAKII